MIKLHIATHRRDLRVPQPALRMELIEKEEMTVVFMAFIACI